MLKNRVLFVLGILVAIFIIWMAIVNMFPSHPAPEQNTLTDEPLPVPTPAPKPAPKPTPVTPSKVTGKNEIIVSPQKPGGIAIIDQVTLAVPGFVVIHEENRGIAGRVLAFSKLLPKGISKNVSVTVALSPGAGYVAMLHGDSDGGGIFAPNTDQPLNDLSGNVAMANFYASAPITTSVANYTVTIKNYAFSPASVTLKRGDLVLFRNDDTTIHTITAAAFGGKHVIEIGKSYSLDTKNLSAGTYTYTCDYHPSMNGTIIVQ